jgi:hypothetical protein
VPPVLCEPGCGREPATAPDQIWPAVRSYSAGLNWKWRAHPLAGS